MINYSLVWWHLAEVKTRECGGEGPCVPGLGRGRRLEQPPWAVLEGPGHASLEKKVGLESLGMGTSKFSGTETQLRMASTDYTKEGLDGGEQSARRPLLCRAFETMMESVGFPCRHASGCGFRQESIACIYF